MVICYTGFYNDVIARLGSSKRWVEAISRLEHLNHFVAQGEIASSAFPSTSSGFSHNPEVLEGLLPRNDS